MFVVINAPEGVLNDECRVVGTFDCWSEAYDAMFEDMQDVLKSESDDMDDYSTSAIHGTCYLDRPDAPEWHIFEV